MKRRFYLPFDEVADLSGGISCFLLFPTLKRDVNGCTRWMLLAKTRPGIALRTRTSRFRLSDFNGFSNITVNPPKEHRI